MLEGLLSRILGQAARGAEFQHPMANYLVRLLGRVQEHALGRWYQGQLTGVTCSIIQRTHTSQVPCQESMSIGCGVCGAPCCLSHATVSLETGEGVCMACIAIAREARAQGMRKQVDRAPTDHELRRRHARTLKMKGPITVDSVKAAWKREAAKTHPDHAPEGKKQEAHERFVEIGKAKDWLLDHLQKRAAAA